MMMRPGAASASLPPLTPLRLYLVSSEGERKHQKKKKNRKEKIIRVKGREDTAVEFSSRDVSTFFPRISFLL